MLSSLLWFFGLLFVGMSLGVLISSIIKKYDYVLNTLGWVFLLISQILFFISHIV